jgi:hypothetical protein
VLNREGTGRNARRASEEITSPTGFRSMVASSLAAARTSSSMARVVLIFSLFLSLHHASIITHLSEKCKDFFFWVIRIYVFHSFA